MYNIPQIELASIIAQLDNAIAHHEAWYKQVSQMLVCRTTPDTKDLAADAHRHCKFGEWYYTHVHPRMREHPAFDAIEPLHEQMHQYATLLLLDLRSDRQIKTEDYQRFSAALERMRLQITTLSNELADIWRQLDPLTGVYTRGGMLTNLRNHQERVKRGRYKCTITMMDIDDFKFINDQHGHPAGDEVLREVGSFLCHDTRIYDEVYRYGGEEFLIVFPDCELASTVTITERLCDRLSKLSIDIANGTPLRISASFGLYELSANTSVSESISRADRAMYTAKQRGKNRFVCWSDGLAESSQ